MKTAKEVCESIKNERVTYWINQIEIQGGKINLEHSLDESIIEKLKELGFNVRSYMFRKYLTEMPIYEEKTIHYFFGLFSKKLSFIVGSEPVYIDLPCIEISACCGEENET